MKITVFGGSTALPGENAYQEAMRLGRLLASAGHTVLTGGYIGTMEAVSRGAAEAGGHVVGVTCQEIETWRQIGPNAWVQEELRFATLRERLFALIDGCDAALALPGGPGTLAEIAIMWNSMIVAAIPPRPLILIGAGWEDVFASFFVAQGAYTSEQGRRLLTFAEDGDEAVLEINHFIENCG
jgi:uncharacterized protein (TIGR00725 family)